MKKTKHFNPKHHINNLITNQYYKDLVSLRNVISHACDNFFLKQGAPKIDLYMIAQNVSSPTGKGSDSIPIPLTLGKQSVYLVDSAQFGLEPLVSSGNFNMVYCYLPSFRGENSDDRHLNQFYHCEAELAGTYIDGMNTAEKLIKHLISVILENQQKFHFEQTNFNKIKEIVKQDFPRLTFDEVENVLNKKGYSNLIIKKEFGRVISNKGEKKACELITGNKLPIWITKYDRDVVPFYQKPDPENSDSVLNSDLILPSINNSFGGEVIGSGERQNNASEIEISIKRQNIKNIKNYEWYLKLREHKNYRITSGFGLGIERFLAWMLGLNNIADVSIYPVLKNQKISY